MYVKRDHWKPKRINPVQVAMCQLFLWMQKMSRHGSNRFIGGTSSRTFDRQTAKETLDNLNSAFEDLGLIRKVEPLRTWTSTTLKSSASMEDYANKILTTSYINLIVLNSKRAKNGSGCLVCQKSMNHWTLESKFWYGYHRRFGQSVNLLSFGKLNCWKWSQLKKLSYSHTHSHLTKKMIVVLLNLLLWSMIIAEKHSCIFWKRNPKWSKHLLILNRWLQTKLIGE